MSVIRNTYATSLNVQPYYVRIEKNPSAQESIIIDDDTVIQMTVSNREVVWIKVETDCLLTVLSSEPSDIHAFSPNHSDFDKTLIRVKSAETFIIRHSGLPMTNANRTDITGYQIGANDVIYIKIDHAANTTTIYS